MMIRQLLIFAAIAVCIAASGTATAGTMIVLPGDASWTSTGNSGGGSSAITGTAPYLGDGSIEMFGDRTRFQNFNPGGFGLLNDVATFTFAWQVANDSIAQLHSDYTPALRLHVYDPAAANNYNYSELVWEGAYNGVYGSLTKGVWNETTDSDVFWRWVTGSGVTLDNGAQINQTIEDWADGANSGGTQWYSDQALVVGISVGVGSSAGGAYHAFADNITLGFDESDPVAYNFELTDPSATVPEPASLAVWSLVGAAGALCGWKRRRRLAV